MFAVGLVFATNAASVGTGEAAGLAVALTACGGIPTLGLSCALPPESHAQGDRSMPQNDPNTLRLPAADGPSSALAEPSKIPQRSDIDAGDKWRLEDIYPTNAAWDADYGKVEGLIPTLVAFHGTLGASGDRLLAALETHDAINMILSALITYAGMRRDEDNRVALYQGMVDRATALSTKVREAGSWIGPEVLALDPEIIQGFLATTPGLEIYRHALDDVQRMRAHTLTEREERLLASTGDFADSPSQIFTAFSNADLKYGSILGEDGREMVLTKGRVARALESNDRRVRRDAFERFGQAYAGFNNTLGAAMNANVKTDVFFARTRKYSSALEASLDADHIPTSVYGNLVRTVRDHLGSLHRYTTLRKRWMRLETLEAYDLYAPLVPEERMDVPYGQAKKNVLEGLRPLGSEYLDLLRAGLEAGWIDVYESEGKTSGAYNWGPYTTHPYVLLNYSSTLHDEFTLAHELGHAMHSHFTHTHQPFTYGSYSLFVAEVASTTNEALLITHLLAQPMAKPQRLYMLNTLLEQIRTTLFRQTLFAEFELRTHALAEAGEPLTAEVMNGFYRELYQAYYGPDLHLGAEADVEWSRVPHFYNSFYVYQYATSYAAATLMAEKLLTEGPPMVERYLTFLKSGSSAYPIELLRRAGVDMTTPQPIAATIARFDRVLDEMEQLWGNA
jgi:oligoendopeptidase F